MLWIGVNGEMETELVPRAHIPLNTITAGQIAGISRLKQITNVGKLGVGLVQAYRLIGQFKPDVLFMTGGFVNAPVGLAAKMRGVPAAIYLPDVEPGAAIKRLEPLAQKIACTTDGSAAFLPAEKLVVTGYPVRESLRSALDMSVAEARQSFGLDGKRPTLFVFGGSRGAQSINRALMAILPDVLTFAQVIHVSGTLTWPEVEAFAKELEGLDGELAQHYRPFPYLHEEMGAGFRAADLVVARAGASMLGECPAFGVPAVLIPYPYAWRYQKVNADFLVERGAGIRIDDEKMSEQLLPTIRQLLTDTAKLNKMKQAAHGLDKPDASEQIANLLFQLANR